METASIQIKKLRKRAGLSQSGFADKFEIPTSTLQDWEHERRTPPIYVLKMIETILDNEGVSEEEKSLGNSILNKSKYSKSNDEFYTTYETIQDEIGHYENQFEKKVVYCNCDNPYKSNFALFFIKNFNRFHLKELLCSSLSDSKQESENSKYGLLLRLKSVPFSINENSSDEEVISFLRDSGNIDRLNNDGDFRNDNNINYLKQSDIVVTNPPFSLFREWISLVEKCNKKFLVISNQNAITYKEIFPLIQTNEIWLGYHFGDMAFRVPSDSLPRKTRFWIDDSGQKWRSLGNAMWLTNIDIEKRHKRLDLTEKYSPETFPKYDDYDAIEVPKVADIPFDYKGIMGVPITFLNKYNPSQFKIVGEANHGSDNPFDLFKPMIDGKLKYKRILIQNRECM